MEEKQNSGKTPAQLSLYSAKPKSAPSTRFHLSLYRAQISKNTKYPQYPQYMKGKMGKITKRKSNGRSTKQKKKKQENSETFSHGAKFSHPSAKLLDFASFSTLLSFWFLICNVEFDSNSTCLDRLESWNN